MVAQRGGQVGHAVRCADRPGLRQRDKVFAASRLHCIDVIRARSEHHHRAGLDRSRRWKQSEVKQACSDRLQRQQYDDAPCARARRGIAAIRAE
jgi:hypothetical protein